MTTPGLPPPDPSVFAARREAALNALGRGVLLLGAAPVQYAPGDTERPYAPDRELYYVCGATEPETVAVLIGGDEPRFVLFARERDPAAELWSGPRLGVEGALEAYRPDECHPVTELEERLPALLQEGERIHHRFGGARHLDALVLGALRHARDRGARGGTGPRGVIDPGEILDELRLHKTEDEIELLRRAAQLSAEGHRAGAAAIAPGVGEWQVQAAIDGAFRRGGAGGTAYETIVGAGANACVLHYVANSDRIGAQDLVLVDAGAEYGLYNGDITRVYPASGHFTELQKELYQLVDGARTAAIAVASPGVSVGDVHSVAARTLTEGLVDLGVLEGQVDELIETGAYRAWFPHQTSHWLGLQTHDPGDYARAGESRVLEEGMVFTVEPGLYFPPAAADGPAALFSGIGIRIEDDVLITADGREVLTASLPTSIAEVESLVGSP